MQSQPQPSEAPHNSVADTPATDPSAIERRLERNLPLVSVLMVSAAGWKFGWNSALSVGFGCVLSFINYRWLHASLRAILATTQGQFSKRRISKFVVRWIVIGAAMVVAANFVNLSVLGMLVGLSALPAAVMMEAGFQSYWILRHGIDDSR